MSSGQFDGTVTLNGSDPLNRSDPCFYTNVTQTNSSHFVFLDGDREEKESDETLMKMQKVKMQAK